MKHVPPDVKAARIWLSSRMPDLCGKKKGTENEADSFFLQWLEAHGAKRNYGAVGNDEGGRPAYYRGQESCRIPKAMALLGATDHEIAAALDISISTFNQWRCTHAEFSEALKIGNEKVNAAVEGALVRRALGYSYPNEKVICARNGAIARVKIIEHVPPDVNAANIWLLSRMPDLYREKKETEAQRKRRVGEAYLAFLEEIEARGGTRESRTHSASPRGARSSVSQKESALR